MRKFGENGGIWWYLTYEKEVLMLLCVGHKALIDRDLGKIRLTELLPL